MTWDGYCTINTMQGKLEEQKAIAISLLDILEDKTISEKVGLSEKEVKELRSNWQ